jgi:hypothetical protein
MITTDDIRNAANTKILYGYAKELEVKNYTRCKRAELEEKLIAALGEQTEEKVEETPLETPREFFERVSKIVDESELKTECEELIRRLGTENITPKSKANKLQPYSRLFKTLTPSESNLPQNLFFAYRFKESNPIDRHKFFLFTGLSEIDWTEADAQTKARKSSKSKSNDELADALNEESKVFSVTRYVKTLTKLLNSNDAWEIAVGLIASSGRRPFEIVINGNFESVQTAPKYITYPEYAVKVDGLAKKRGKNPTTIVPLFIPTNEFLQALNKFRNNSEVRKFKDIFDNLVAQDIHPSDAWKALEDKIGYKLRGVTDSYFSFLPKIDDGQNRKNILLRACTLKLLTLRDTPKANTKARLQYAGLVAGHITPIFKEDGGVSYDGKTSASTLNYDDYEPDILEIPLLTNIVKNTEENEDMTIINELKATIEKLQLELSTKDEKINTLEAKLEIKKNREKLPDAEDMDTSMLLSTRKKGSSEEKIKRSYMALTEYNDTTPENRIAINNSALRMLSGVNGIAVTKWMKEHEDEIIGHNTKYDMATRGNDLTTYYNRKYGSTELSQLLEVVRQEYLK